MATESNESTSGAHPHAAAAARMSKDFKIKECPAYLGCMGSQGKGFKVLCMNDAEIPLTYLGFKDKKQASCGLIVINCLMDGFSKVPYESAKAGAKGTKRAEATLPLSEKVLWPGDPEGTLCMMKCWPYGIIEGFPRDKDDWNEEYKWEVHPGRVLLTQSPSPPPSLPSLCATVTVTVSHEFANRHDPEGLVLGGRIPRGSRHQEVSREAVPCWARRDPAL